MRLLVCMFALLIYSCESDAPPPEIAEENPDSIALAGGTLTQSSGFTSRILLQYPPALFGIDLQRHREGAGIFLQTFVPPSAPQFFGLGPVYAATGCFRCHVNAGRGRPINFGEPAEGLLMYISRSGVGPFGGPDSVPGLGVVLQPRAIVTRKPEGEIRVQYRPISGSFGDGESWSLREPTYSVRNPNLPPGVLASTRIASPLVGLGLLENISEADILANEDPTDTNGDGITGVANRVWNVLTNSQTVGRFGWKAGIASVRERAAFDFNQAMGVTSSLGLYSRESCFGQPQAAGAVFDDPEVQANETLIPITSFLKTTAVPGRRNMNAENIRRGQKLFTDGKCAVCHRPQMRTTHTLDEELKFYETRQIFYPYSDLLLHDMGEGLADNRPEFQATGREWRTPPLWGIGLTETINGNAYYMHDGRARSLEEAILWHGGEADQSKQFFLTLPKSDRDALIAFIRSL